MVEASTRLTLGSYSVARLGFGTMQLTGPGVWGPPADRATAIAVLRRAVDLGVELFDTADSYGPSVAEELVRDALSPYPANVRVATKAGLVRPGPGQWVERADPAYLRAQCEGSLRRLGVDRIDLFQLHRIDSKVPVEDQFAVLAALREEGKVAEVGLSEVTVDQLRAAREIVPVVSVQNLYNLAHRGAQDVLAYCDAHRIAFLPWFPLDSGRLSRPGGPIENVVASTGATASQVCLAWLLRCSPMMLPIPGTSSLVHLEENCAGSELVLSEAQFAELTDGRRKIRRWALSAR